jgi:adenosylcobinamide-phosphate synthase
MLKWTWLAVIIGFLLDLCMGDPRWLYHPVRIIGNGIVLMEKVLRGIFPRNKTSERLAGVFLVIVIVSTSAAVPFFMLYYAYGYETWLGIVLESFMCYQLLATKSLRDESMKVYEELCRDDLEGARYAVSMIVGRDTKELSEVGVTKATVETIAENASDGVLAPLFYMMFGGAVLGFIYKAINTMDSMVGYKNDRYQYFGTCAAVLDDVVNYIPARIAGGIMILAAYLQGYNGANARKIFLRDRYNHASPNSAQTEAVMAGALGIQLAGDAFYFGKRYEKPTIGEALRAIEIGDIKQGNRLLYGTAVSGVFIFGFIRLLLEVIF